MKRKIFRVVGRISAIGVMLFALGCYPDRDVTISELDLVITMHDDQADFTQFLTFAMPDSIIRIDENGELDLEPGEFDQEILDRIVLNMENLGYVRELNPTVNEADIVLLTEIILIDAYILQSYPPYWGWWGGWYPGWGGGGYYPGWGYPCCTSVSSFTVGTLVMDISDPSQRNPLEMTMPSVWAGAINGLASGSNIESRIITSIDQAFDQSPYLGTN